MIPAWTIGAIHKSAPHPPRVIVSSIMFIPESSAQEADTSRHFSTESYFQTQQPPAGLDEKAKLVGAFVNKWKNIAGKKVVLVTVSS